MTDLVLQPGRERSLRRRHPWVLSGAVDRVDGGSGSGELVRVVSAEGEVLGFGHYAPASRLRVRMLAFGKNEPGEDVVAERIAAAVSRRASDPRLADTDAVRLVNAEGDGLPGLVADRYADCVVVKLGAPGMVARREAIARALQRASGAASGYERADVVASRREGFAARSGILWGAVPSEPVEISEGGRRYRVDVVAGQKTGFYLDQRIARERVQQLAEGRRALDLFAYTGGFAVAAAAGGAERVTLVDSSADALERARDNLARNEARCPLSLERADAFRWLRGGREPFDLLVVDPPPLARARRDVARASRAYKDLLLHALRRAAPDACLFAFACSHHVGPELFRKIAFAAALDAQRTARVEEVFGAPPDHPVSIDHPEGAYLTGLLLRT
jgi:23S rRNA (cytosine1962-C5)-methyltransferase